jgi:nucleolar protein 6
VIAPEAMPSPVQMNAKERRKLQRQQQQGRAAEETKPAVDTAETVKTEPSEVIKTEPAPEATATMNAKERRKLLRQQQQQAQPAVEIKGEAKEETAKKDTAASPPPVPAVAGERLNAKERRLLQRKETRGEDPQKSSKKETAQIGKKRKRKEDGDPELDAEEEAKRKRIHLTLFVGQLPFKCTEAAIRKHFSEAGDIQLRMLTDKKTKKFKGTAFIEVKDSKALGAALSRHHSLLNGRRINVELTASGGGNKSELRRGKIDTLRKKQSEKQIEKTRALVQKCIDAPGSKLKAEDVDERMIDFLSWFDYETAKTAMDEYNRCVSDRVKNTKAFFMGILKRFRQTDGVE